jgi:hypothetical protein
MAKEHGTVSTLSHERDSDSDDSLDSDVNDKQYMEKEK